MTSEPTFLTLAVIALLLVFAVGVCVHVWLAGRETKFSLRSAAGRTLSFVWALPVLAVLVLFAGRASDHLRHESGDSLSTVVPREIGGGASGRPAVTDRAPADLADDAPDWVRERAGRSARTPVLSSTFRPVVEDAEKDLLAETARRIEADFRRTHSYQGPWTVPDQVVRAHAVARSFVETKEETVKISRAGGAEVSHHSFPVHRVHWELDLSSEARSTLRAHLVKPRFRILGSSLGLLALMLGTSAAYLRLDAQSAGKYRTRLKLAAVALIVASGLAATTLLPV